MHASPAGLCIRCCEEVRELHVPIIHGSYYEARPPVLGWDAARSPCATSSKVILAMRPDRIIVGEVRGAEAFELTRAVNAGCGFGCTIHANSARDALNALVNAAMMAGENVSESVVRKVFGASIDLVIHLDRDTAASGTDAPMRRQVMEVLALVPALHHDFSTQPLFARTNLGAPLEWTGAMPPDSLADRLAEGAANGRLARFGHWRGGCPSYETVWLEPLQRVRPRARCWLAHAAVGRRRELKEGYRPAQGPLAPQTGLGLTRAQYVLITAAVGRWRIPAGVVNFRSALGCDSCRGRSGIAPSSLAAATAQPAPAPDATRLARWNPRSHCFDRLGHVARPCAGDTRCVGARTDCGRRLAAIRIWLESWAWPLPSRSYARNLPTRPLIA